MQKHINVQALTVEAILTGNREHIYHAAMLDPHTGAELDLDQIWQLVDDLITEHAEWIPHQFRNSQSVSTQPTYCTVSHIIMTKGLWKRRGGERATTCLRTPEIRLAPLPSLL